MARESRFGRRGLEPWLQGIIVAGLFVYVWKGIQPQLLYYGFGVFSAYPVFSFESPFLRTALSTPGGTLSALIALLMQSYRVPWLGAAVIAMAIAALVLGIQRLLRSVQAGRFRDLAWAPLILAAVIYHRYEDPLVVLLATGLSVWAAVLYNSLRLTTLSRRAGVFLALFAVAYQVSGASAFVFAGIVCLTDALLQRKMTSAIVEAALALGAAFLLGWPAFGLEPTVICAAGTPWDPTGPARFSPLARLLILVLYAFVPGLIPLAFVTRIGTGWWLRRRAQGTAPTEEPPRASRWKAYDPRVWVALRMLLVSAVIALCLVLTRTHIRFERALNYHACRRQWDQVVALARRMQGKHAFTRSGVFDINRALAHEGRLGDELCAYPQDGTKTLFLSFEDMAGRLQHSKTLELYLDLGCVNAAEKNAYELLDNEGPSPYVLGAMLRIHLVKGEYQTAGIVFKALQKYAGSREYVRRWQDIVAEPARAQDDPLLQAWRRAKGATDYGVGGISFEPTLRRLLQDAPNHRLAFEYLMACYLLEHQRSQLVDLLPLLKPLGYKRLPRLYAEALLVHALETRTPVAAQGWTIEPDVYDEFRQIHGIVTQAHGDYQAVFDTLAPKYGHTYTFYSMFNVCGVE